MTGSSDARDIVCWGDSLTAHGGMPTRLAELTGRTCHNAGVGGENSLGVAARQGAMPYLVTVSGGVIPAEGGVDVAVRTSFSPAVAAWPLVGGAGAAGDVGTGPGRLAGVDGTLQLRVKDPTVPAIRHGGGDVYAFVRKGPGPPIRLGSPTPFYFDFARARRRDIAIVWMGENGPGDDTTSAMFEAIALALVPGTPFLFMTSCGDIHPGWTPLERRLIARWGRRFLNVRRYLIDEAPEDIGVPLTPRDRDDRARGRVPTSLRTDDVHHTLAAQRAIAEHLILARMREFDWIST